MSAAICVENLGKSYRLGLTHSRSVRELVNLTASRLLRRGRRTIVVPKSESAARASESGLFWALREISFAVQPGEVIGIIGKNGAGKSTLLKILSRITAPTTGRVEIRGRVASLLEVGTGFHPELTGRENIFLNGAILGMTRGEVARKLDAIVDFAEVEQFLDTPVKRYSSGMYVRLAFAVAAHLDPEILIVDEVLAVGDAAFQKKCLGKMSDVSTAGRTVLFVSHNMAAVRSLTKNCLVISDGKVAFQGPSSDAVELYLDQHRAQLKTAADIAQLPRVSWCGDRSIEFTQARLIFSGNQKLGLDDDLCLNVSVRAREDVKDFSFGMTVSTKTGSPVATAFTGLVGGIRESESASFTFTIAASGLAPGEYWITPAVIRNSTLVVDVLDKVLHFEVLPDGRLPEGILEWNAAWGHLKMHVACLRN